LNEKTKNILSYFFRIVLSAALLGYLFHNMDVSKVGESFRNADMTYMFFAFVTFLVIHAFLLLRWKIMIDALGLKVPFSAIVHYFFVGLFFNLFLPTSTGGDIVKVIGLCRYTEHKPKVVASAVLDRLSGFIGMMILALIAYACGHRLINQPSLLISIALIGLIPVSLLSVLFSEKIYGFCCRIFDHWPKVKKPLMDLHYDIALLKHRKDAFFWVVGVSLICQVILALTFFLVAKALHQDVAFMYFLIFVPLICVASSLPSIGGLGVRDAGSVYLFAKAGVSATTAVGLSLMNFVFMVIVGLIGGVLYVTALSSGRVQHHQKRAGIGAVGP